MGYFYIFSRDAGFHVCLRTTNEYKINYFQNRVQAMNADDAKDLLARVLMLHPALEWEFLDRETPSDPPGGGDPEHQGGPHWCTCGR